MISMTSLIGLMLLAVFTFLAWKRRPSCVDKASNAPEDVEQEVLKPCDAPDADAWCMALEEMCEGAVLCFDESLRLKAWGNRAMHMIANAQAQLHLVDIAPSSATSKLLEMMALARRGTVVSGDVSWRGISMQARAAPVGKSWITLSIKRVLALSMAMFFACVACSSKTIDQQYSHLKRQDCVPARSVNERLAYELIRHGRLLLRSGRYLDAMYSGALATFLSDNPQSLAFVSEYQEALSREIKATKRLAADARDAGDHRESARIESLTNAMMQHLEAR